MEPAPPRTEDRVPRSALPVHLARREVRVARSADPAGELRLRARAGPRTGGRGRAAATHRAHGVASPTIQLGSTLEAGAVPITFGRADDNRAVLDDDDFASGPPRADRVVARGRLDRRSRLDERHVGERRADERTPQAPGRRRRPHRPYGASVRAMSPVRSQTRRGSPTRDASGAATRTRSSSTRRSSSSPTAWAARRRARSRPGSPPPRSASSATPTSSSGEERVAATVQEANRRIYERAREDADASGMGTTVTAALLGDETIAIGHVGDSRAYRIRGDELEQLTDDHSLVAELVRSGRLTPEEADIHPQRSVITRALGTDPDVDVDTFVVAPEPGDVYLLCSDGLTTMVPGPEILRIVGESSSLDQAGRALVKAANRSGGEDNITVVLFSIAGEPPRRRARPSSSTTRWSASSPWRSKTTRRTAGRRSSTRRRRRFRTRSAAARAASSLAARSCSSRRSSSSRGSGGSRTRTSSAPRRTDSLAVYQGLPYDLGGGISLYRVRYVSLLDAAQLSEEERAELFDHDLMSFDDARDAPRAARDRGDAVTARNRELMNLVVVGMLTAIGFATVYIASQEVPEFSGASLTYAAFFLAVFLVAHFACRAGAAVRRSVPAPHRRPAHRDRADDDLPDRAGRRRSARASGS